MKKTRKNLIIAFILCILLCTYVYVCAIDAIPESAILFEGENLRVKTLFGLTLQTEEKQYKSILTSASSEENQTDQESVLGNTNVKVKLFNSITVKEVNVSVIERATVVPIGQIAGLKLYTSGVLVVGMSEIKGLDNEKYKPYENTGIQEGDRIIEIGDNYISDTDGLLKVVNNSKGENLEVVYVRDGETLECNIKPVQTSKDEYKLGLWVRDSAAGIGTMTFYEPSTNKFAALGHGISDIDKGEIINIANGDFITTKIVSIIKGKKGNPGKIQGTIENQNEIGKIYKNTNLGIYGVIEDISAVNLSNTNKMQVAMRDEIKLGKATILCSLDNITTKEYNIEIEKININNNYDNKSMLIKVTDDELLNKTGGIIQGMSGCPIIQNGKFIGAVTNVLVNDPTQGYGIFGDLMIKNLVNLGTVPQ